jgi:hypothetical protein
MSEEDMTTPLEAAAAAESMVDDSYDASADSLPPVVVYTATSEEDGEIVRGLLESEGIEVVLTTSGSPVYGQVFGIAEGQWGEVLVAPGDAERAKAILAAASSLESIDEN